MQALLLAAMTICFGEILGLGIFFFKGAKVFSAFRLFLNVLMLAVMAYALFSVVFLETVETQQLLALILYCGGGITLFLAWRAAKERPPGFIFLGDVPSSIISSGIYQVIRHPFYTGYLLIWGGTLLVVEDVRWVIGPILLVAGSLVREAVREERDILQGPAGDAYRRYMLTAGRFFPKMRS